MKDWGKVVTSAEISFCFTTASPVDASVQFCSNVSVYGSYFGHRAFTKYLKPLQNIPLSQLTVRERSIGAAVCTEGQRGARPTHSSYPLCVGGVRSFSVTKQTSSPSPRLGPIMCLKKEDTKNVHPCQVMFRHLGEVTTTEATEPHVKRNETRISGSAKLTQKLLRASHLTRLSPLKYPFKKFLGNTSKLTICRTSLGQWSFREVAYGEPVAPT